MEKVKVIPKGTPQGTFGIPSAFDRYEVTHTPDPKPEPVQQAQEPVAQTTPTQPQEPEKKFYQKSLDEGDTKSASIEGLTKLVNHFTKSSGKTEDEVLQQCEDLLGYPKEMIEQYKAQKQQTPDKVSWEDATKKYDETDLYSTIRKKTLEYTKQGLSIEEAKKKALEPFKDVDLEKASKLGVFGRYINDLSKNKGEADIEDNLADTLRVFKTKESADKMLESYGITDQAFKDKVWDIAKKGRFEGSYEYQQLAKKYEGDFTKAPQEEQLKAMKDYVAGLPDRIKNDSFRRFTRGFTSALDGLAVMAKGLSEATTGTAPKWLQDYATENAQENALAKELISQEGTFDLAGIAGQMLSLLPLGRLGIGATALGTIAKGAGVGGVSSALISAGEGKKAEDVQKDLLIGAGVGGALGGLFEGVKSVGSKVINQFKGNITTTKEELTEKLKDLKYLKTLSEESGVKIHPVQLMNDFDARIALSNPNIKNEYKRALTEQIGALTKDLEPIYKSGKDLNAIYKNANEIKEQAKKVASGAYAELKDETDNIVINSKAVSTITKDLKDLVETIKQYGGAKGETGAENLVSKPITDIISRFSKNKQESSDVLKDELKQLIKPLVNTADNAFVNAQIQKLSKNPSISGIKNLYNDISKNKISVNEEFLNSFKEVVSSAKTPKGFITASDLIDLQKVLNYELRGVSQDSLKAVKSKIKDTIESSLDKNTLSKLKEADANYAKYINTFKNADKSILAKALNDASKKNTGTFIEEMTKPIKGSDETAQYFKLLPELGDQLTTKTREQLANKYLDKVGIKSALEDALKPVNPNQTESKAKAINNFLNVFKPENLENLPYYMARKPEDIKLLQSYFTNLADTANRIFTKLQGGTVILKADEPVIVKTLRYYLGYVQQKLFMNITKKYSVESQIKKTEAEIKNIEKSIDKAVNIGNKTPIVTGVTVPNITD